MLRANIGRWIVSAVALTGVVTMASMSWADEAQPDYARRGIYVGMGPVYAFEDADLPSVPGFDLSLDDSWGFDARTGYRWRYAAWEAQFQYYDDFTLDADPGSKANINAQSFSTNLKGYPLTGRIQPYGLAGFGFLRTSTDAQGTNRVEVEFIGRFGGGVDTYITPNVLMYVEGTYLIPKAELKDFNIVPLAFGVQYRFD